MIFFFFLIQFILKKWPGSVSGFGSGSIFFCADPGSGSASKLNESKALRDSLPRDLIEPKISCQVPKTCWTKDILSRQLIEPRISSQRSCWILDIPEILFNPRYPTQRCNWTQDILIRDPTRDILPRESLLLAHSPVYSDGREVLLNQKLSHSSAALHALHKYNNLKSWQWDKIWTILRFHERLWSELRWSLFIEWSFRFRTVLFKFCLIMDEL